MSIIAEFVIPTEAVPGGEALSALPSATIRMERIVPTDGELRPIFWVTGANPDRFVELAHREAGITAIQELTRLDHRALYMAVWSPESPIIEGVKTLQATILDAVGTADRWVFQVRADERSRLQEFIEGFAAHGIPVELKRISSIGDDEEREPTLTPKQHRTLIAAYELGYYDEPRAVTQDAIGDRFGISGRAVSKRLRRGTRNLIESTLIDPPVSRDLQVHATPPGSRDPASAGVRDRDAETPSDGDSV